MKLPVRCVIAALLIVAPPGMAAAQPVAAVPTSAIMSRAAPTEKDRLAAQFLHVLFDAWGFDIEAELRNEAGELDQAFKEVKDRPEWGGMLRGAIAAEIKQDMPRLELALGHDLFGDFSVAELRAGVAFLSAPGGRQIVAAAKQTPDGRGAKLSPAGRKALDAMEATPVGRSFLDKFGALGGDLSSKMTPSVVRIVLPGALVSFADRIRVAESQRPARVAASPEAEQLGGELAHTLFAIGDIRTEMKTKLGDFDTPFADPMFPAEWSGLMREAVGEEIDAEIPFLETLFGRALGEHFTLDELRAGVALFRGPVGKNMVAAFAAERQGAEPPQPSKADQKAMEQFMKTPAGSGFMKKLSTLGQIRAEDSTPEFLITFLPATFRRFGEKVLAREAAIAAVS